MLKSILGSTQSSGFFIRYVAIDMHITLNIAIITRVVITEYSVLHHSIKGEKITLDNPNPEIAIPVAKPLCSLNHNISVFTGDK